MGSDTAHVVIQRNIHPTNICIHRILPRFEDDCVSPSVQALSKIRFDPWCNRHALIHSRVPLLPRHNSRTVCLVSFSSRSCVYYVTGCKLQPTVVPVEFMISYLDHGSLNTTRFDIAETPGSVNLIHIPELRGDSTRARCIHSLVLEISCCMSVGRVQENPLVYRPVHVVFAFPVSGVVNREIVMPL